MRGNFWARTSLRLKKYELYLKILSKLDEPFARAFISTALQITAPFNNIRTLKFKPQQTNAFFATANQIFGGSSQPPTTAERAVLKSLITVQTTKQYLAVASRKLRGASNIWLTVAKNEFVGWALNFNIRMLLKVAVNVNAKLGSSYQCGIFWVIW